MKLSQASYNKVKIDYWGQSLRPNICVHTKICQVCRSTVRAEISKIYRGPQQQGGKKVRKLDQHQRLVTTVLAATDLTS